MRLKREIDLVLFPYSSLCYTQTRKRGEVNQEWKEFCSFASFRPNPFHSFPSNLTLAFAFSPVSVSSFFSLPFEVSLPGCRKEKISFLSRRQRGGEKEKREKKAFNVGICRRLKEEETEEEEGKGRKKKGSRQMDFLSR